MNAADQVERLLKESGAVLARQNKHLVYKLPNGQTFVMAKTTGDPVRAAKNNLRDLRHALGNARPKQEEGRTEMATVQPQPFSAAPAPAPVVMRPEPAVAGLLTEVVQTMPDQSLKERIEVAIARQEKEQELLMNAASAVERRLQMLKALLPFVDDPSMESVLLAILSRPEPPKPAHPQAPDHISECVQVTRKLVYAATQTFEGGFTINDVMKLMTGGRHIEGTERVRVRNSIAASITSLFDRGELLKDEQGIGKHQSIWRKAVLNGKPVVAVAESATV